MDVVLDAPGAPPPRGCANSGPISTSKPRSAKAEAITFWPRSCPSWPILATRMRGRRPIRLREGRRSSPAPGRPQGSSCRPPACRRPRSTLISAPVAAEHALHAPWRSRRPSPWRAPPRPKASRRLASPLRRPASARSSAAVDARPVALGLQPGELVELPGPDRGVVDLEHVDRRLVLAAEPVDADDRLLRRRRCAPASWRPPPRSAASACRPRSPSPCRRALRPPRCGVQAFAASSAVRRST